MADGDVFGASAISLREVAENSYESLRGSLDTDQAAVVDMPIAAVGSVAANAGSGKTRTIVARLVRYVAEGGNPAAAAAITFTTEATNQIRSRYAEYTADDPERRSRRSRPTIGTVHAFGLRLLAQHFGLRWTPLSQAENRRLVRDLPTFQAVRPDYKLLMEALASLSSRAEMSLLVWPEFDGAGKLVCVHDVCSAATGQFAGLSEQEDFPEIYAKACWFAETAVQRRIRQLPPERTHLTRMSTLQAHATFAGMEIETFLQLILEYQTAKYKSCVLEFSDMLTVPLLLMLQHAHFRERARGRYKLLLVDEAQDLSAADFALISMVAGFPEWSRWWPQDRGLLVVGDSKQSIYEWRNGLPLVMDNFDRYLGYDAVDFRALRQNFRSLSPIVHVCNDFARAFERRNLHDSVPVRTSDTDQAIEICSFSTTALEDKGLIKRLREVNAAGVPWSSCVVLLRWNRDLDQLQAAMIAAGIPYRTRGNRRLSGSAAFAFVNALLGIAINPRNVLATSPLLLSMHGIGEKTVVPIQTTLRSMLDRDLLETVESALARVPGRSSISLQALLGKLLPELRMCIQGQPLRETVERLDMILSSQFAWPDVEGSHGMRMTLHGQPVLHVLRLLAGVLTMLEADADFSAMDTAAQLHHLCTSLSLAEEPDEEGSNPKGLLLTTIHGFKGGEADYVFVPHLTRQMPIMRADIDGERCIFNVAVTRAREFLYLSSSEKIRVDRFWRRGVVNTNLVDFQAQHDFRQRGGFSAWKVEGDAT